MALTSDLIGLGTPGFVADLIGFAGPASITAAGTTSVDATVLKKGQDVVVLTGTGSDGIRMAADSPAGIPYAITCISGGAKVYPTTGGTINGGATDAGITVGANKAAFVTRYSTNGWMLNLSA